MGWARGYSHEQGREVGYGIEAICDFPKCKARIDRGLDYACGGGHAGMSEGGCAHYFCRRHRYGKYRENSSQKSMCDDGMIAHNFATHVRGVRRERRALLVEMLRFRSGEPISALKHWWPLWRFANKRPNIGVPGFDHGTVFYTRRAA